LDQLGFDIPQDAKTIALLEDEYVLRVSALRQMLKRFYDVLDVLDPSQVTYTVTPPIHHHRHYYILLLHGGHSHRSLKVLEKVFIFSKYFNII